MMNSSSVGTKLVNIFRITIFLLCLGLTQSAYAKFYEWVDKNGKKHYTSYPPPYEATEATEAQGNKNKPTQASPSPQNTTGPKKFRYSDIPAEFDISRGVSLKIRKMLRKRRFDALNSLLHKYQIGAESNLLAEDILFASYNAFRKNDPSYEKLLNEWIAKFPGMYQPHLARAEFYYNLAWESRGAKWASETTQEQFSGMEKYFEKAIEDINKARTLYKKCLVPYQLLLNIVKTEQGNEKLKSLLQEALQINPASYKIRATYLLALTPRWGGDYLEMNAFANDSLTYASQNPKIRILPGLVHDDLGLVNVTLKKYSVAEEHYTKALTYGDNHVIYYHRGKARYKNKQYNEALKDLNRAIQIYKDNSDYYYWRALTYSKMEEYDNSVESLTRAEELESNNEYYTKLRKYVASKIALQAHESDKNENTADSISKYDKAISLEPDNAIMRYNKAITLYNNYKLDEALAELEKAIELDSNEINFYIAIDAVLAEKKQWSKIIGYWDDFIFNHPNNGRAYLERAGAHRHKGDQASAISDLESAAELGNRPAAQLLKRMGR